MPGLRYWCTKEATPLSERDSGIMYCNNYSCEGDCWGISATVHDILSMIG